MQNGVASSAGSSWRFRSAIDEYTFARRSNQSPAASGIPATLISWHFESWLARPGDRGTILDIYRACGGFDSRPSASEVHRRVMQAIARGDLVVTRAPPRKLIVTLAHIEPLGPEDPPSERPSEPTRPRERPLAWIEIAVVDGAGKPITGRDYRLVMADGSVREGTLAADGIIRYEDIEAGLCELSFPTKNEREWRPLDAG